MSRFQHLVRFLICLFLIPLMLTACSKGKEEGDSSEAATSNAKDAAAQDSAPPEVVATTVKTEDVPIYGEWTGQTDASQTVNIRSRVNGELIKASFKEGDYVDQGQVLFQIDPNDYKTALESAKAELSKAKAQLVQATEQVAPKEQKATQQKYESALTRAELDLTRIKALTAQGAMSQHDLDVAVDAAKQARAQAEAQKFLVSDTDLNKSSSISTTKAQVEAAQAALKQAELNLGYTTIKSPLRGIIGKIQVYPGNIVNKFENTTLATISAVDPIKVDFSVSDAEYLKVAKDYARTGEAKDAPLELSLADNSTYPYKGKFKLVDRAVDSKTGTIGIEALFPNPKAILRPGEFAKVRSLFEMKKNAVLIPDKCVQDLQGSKTVYVVGPENKVEMKTVTLGSKSKDKVVVLSGLKAGDRVIVEGLQKAVPGQPVRIASGSTP